MPITLKPIIVKSVQDPTLPAAAMERFQKEYDLQMGSGALHYDAYAKLLHENETCWIVHCWLVLGQEVDEVVTVIYKDPDRRMEWLNIM